MTSQTPVQIAWVTRDLDATEAALTTLLGARKWIRMPDVHFGPETCVHRGVPADHHADISLSYAGDTQLELIAPTRGESVYSEFLAENGPGLHHICVEVADPDALEAALATAAATAPVLARGEMPGGMLFAYLAAPAAGVPYFEIAYVPDTIRAFYDYVKQEQQ
ncbi:VOC family protein [Mycolicibacterium sarraceniae]|nr:VOC family protein [Mycolicibacterium sarraceniae]